MAVGQRAEAVEVEAPSSGEMGDMSLQRAAAVALHAELAKRWWPRSLRSRAASITAALEQAIELHDAMGAPAQRILEHWQRRGEELLSPRAAATAQRSHEPPPPLLGVRGAPVR